MTENMAAPQNAPGVDDIVADFQRALSSRRAVPGAASPSAVPAPVAPVAADPAQGSAGGYFSTLPVSYDVIAELRHQASLKVSQAAAADGTMNDADRRQHGMQVISKTVSEWAVKYAGSGQAPLTDDEETALRKAVFDELFRAGRLQPLLDDPNVENILINGAERVRVDYSDRPSQMWEPIAPSDQELVRLINHIARTGGQGERALTPATPNLNMRLADGSRLAASYGITPRPQVVIRRHRTRGQGLDDLVKWGTIDSTLAAFIKAAVRARKNVIIVGSQGVGKTSLLRAAAREIPRTERVGTLESEYELYLHEDPEGPEVVAYEGRESNGERGPDGKLMGELTLSDLFPQLLRMSLRRIIVGEVRSKEVVPMLHAMNEGEGGSMCTLHARSALLSIERLTTLCLEAGINMSEQLALRLIAQAVDLVIYIRLVDETELVDDTGRPGRKHRFVSHVMEITGVGENGRPSHQMIFAPREQDGHREPRAVPHGMPSPTFLADIERVGFDRTLLMKPWGAWEDRLKTVMPV
ncbi:CpaF family protein [Streptomyces netropsis]|uniref:CpaF family protein n=1 Tax=Streptomyces netropsis TaxID=55404 RepID=UPI003797F5AE